MISCEMQNLDAVCDLADRLHEQAKAPMEAKNLKISQLWIQRSNDERTHYAQTLFTSSREPAERVAGVGDHRNQLKRSGQSGERRIDPVARGSGLRCSPVQWS